MRNLVLVMALTAGLLAAPSWAVQKCTQADGKVIYSDGPCASSAATATTVKTWDNRFNDYREPVQPNMKLGGPRGSGGLLEIYRRWADTERVLLATSRVAMTAPVTALQALQREAESMPIHDCLAPAKTAFLALSMKTIDTAIAFMKKEGLVEYTYSLLDRPKLIQSFEKAVTAAKC